MLLPGCHCQNRTGQKGEPMSDLIIRLLDYERTCRNCVYLDGDSCSCPNGWFLDDRNRCAQFKRKQKQEGE